MNGISCEIRSEPELSESEVIDDSKRNQSTTEKWMLINVVDLVPRHTCTFTLQCRLISFDKTKR